MKPKKALEHTGIIRASKDVIGKKVVNLLGEDVGDIEEVVIDYATGRVTYAVMSFGGFLGIGDKLFAVPWMSLGYNKSDDMFVMKVNKELLKNAPGFDKSSWPDMSDPDHLNEVYRHYGYDRYFQ